MNSKIQIRYRHPTVSEYQELRNTTEWWEVDETATEIALQNSLFSVIAIETDRVVGFGRIVGDGGLYFYIPDLIVHPDFQGTGVGKRLMNELMIYIRKTAKPGAFVGFMAAKGLEKYCEAFGFKARDNNAPGMYLIIK